MNGMGVILSVWCAVLGLFTTVMTAQYFGSLFDILALFFLSTIAAPPLLGRWLGRRLTAISALRRFEPRPSGRVLLCTVVASMTLGVVGSVTFSKSYWGYYFFRPASLISVDEIDRVETFVQVETPYQSGSKLTPAKSDLPDLARRHEKYSYSVPWGRIPGELFHAGKLYREIPEPEPRLIDELHQFLQTSLPERDVGEGVYRTSSGKFRGSLLEMQDQRGQRWLLASLTTGQISNDHFAYYELKFPVSDDGKLGSLSRWNKFYYDVAGIEGLEWWILTPAIAIVLTLVFFPLAAGLSLAHSAEESAPILLR